MANLLRGSSALLLFLVLVSAGTSCDCKGARKPVVAGGGATGTTGMIWVPAGSFMMGAPDSDKEARPCERPMHKVELSGFYMDRHEVTVAQYKEAVEAGAVEAPKCTARNKAEEDLCNKLRADRMDHPVNGVSWFDATDYCKWRGKRLPTAAEFEYAWRAGDEKLVYPWGIKRDPKVKLGNIVGQESKKLFPDWEHIAGYNDGYIGTAPVGSFPANAWGFHDLLGNEWEWCSDWFGSDYYTAETVKDPKGPAKGTPMPSHKGIPKKPHRVMRGGGFHCEQEELRITERHHKAPDDSSFYIGLRCAMDGPERS